MDARFSVVSFNVAIKAEIALKKRDTAAREKLKTLNKIQFHFSFFYVEA
jgi:hypothetical protein